MNSLKRLADLLSTPDRGVSPTRNGGLDAPKGGKISAVRIGVDDDIARFANLIDNSAAVSLGPAKVSLKPLFNLGQPDPGTGCDRVCIGMATSSCSSRSSPKAAPGRLNVRSVTTHPRRNARSGWMNVPRVALFRVPLIAASGGAQLETAEGLIGRCALLNAKTKPGRTLRQFEKGRGAFLAARGLSHGFARFSYLLGVVYVELEELLQKFRPERSLDLECSGAGGLYPGSSGRPPAPRRRLCDRLAIL